MKIVCLEEHVATPEIIAAWQALDDSDKERRLLDVGALRLAAMDAAGIGALPPSRFPAG